MKHVGKELSSDDLTQIAETSIVAVRDTGNFDKVIKEINDVVIRTAAMVNANLIDEDFEFGMATVEDDNQNYSYNPLRRKGGKSNKKRSRKQKLRRRKSLHKKR